MRQTRGTSGRRRTRPRSLRRGDASATSVNEARSNTVKVATVSVLGVLAGSLIGLLGGYLSTSAQLDHDAAMRIREEQRSSCVAAYKVGQKQEEALEMAVFDYAVMIEPDESWDTRMGKARDANKLLAEYFQDRPTWYSSKALLLLTANARVTKSAQGLEKSWLSAHSLVGQMAGNMVGAQPLADKLQAYTGQPWTRDVPALRELWDQAVTALRDSLEGFLQSCRDEIQPAKLGLK